MLSEPKSISSAPKNQAIQKIMLLATLAAAALAMSPPAFPTSFSLNVIDNDQYNITSAHMEVNMSSFVVKKTGGEEIGDPDEFTANFWCVAAVCLLSSEYIDGEI